MTSKIFSNRTSTLLNMFKFSLKNNIGFTVLFWVVCLIAAPGVFFVFLRSANETGYYEGFYDFKNELAVFGLLGGVGTMLFNFVNFTFLYSKKASDVYHAFPLTRTGLLLSKTLSGFVSVTVPILVSYISVFIFNGYMKAKYDIFIDTKLILLSLLFTVLTIIVFSAISMFFIICAGSAFDLILSAFAINVGILLVGSIINWILSENLYGFYSRGYDIYNNLSPIFYLGYAFIQLLTNTEITSAFLGEYIIRTIIYTVVFTVVNIILYNKRKAEKGEEAYAYKFIYIICSIIISFCFGFCAGMLFSNSNVDIVFWIFTVIAVFFAAVVFGAVTDRGFKTVKKSLINGGVAMVLIISVFAIAKTGCLGFESRIPKADKIESVNVSASLVYDTIDIDFTDPEFAMDLHKKISNDKHYSYSTIYKHDTTKVEFVYYLKNGKTLKRSFAVNTESYTSEFMYMLKCNERIEELDEFFYKKIGKTGIIFCGEGSCQITRKEAQNLYELYKKELSKMSEYSILITSPDSEGPDNVYIEFVNEKGKIDYFSIYLDSNFSETIEYVKIFEERVKQEEELAG